MTDPSFADLRTIVEGEWGPAVCQAMNNEDFKKLTQEGFTSRPRLRNARSESLLASGLSIGRVAAISAKTAGA